MVDHTLMVRIGVRNICDRFVVPEDIQDLAMRTALDYLDDGASAARCLSEAEKTAKSFLHMAGYGPRGAA